MTFGEAMAHFYVTFLAAFVTNTVLSLAAGILIGCWVGTAWQARRASARSAGLGSWDTSGWAAESGTVFEPGVAKVGDR